MRSVTRLMLLAVTVPLLSGCAGSTLLQAPTAGCSTLIPASWRQDVPSAVLASDTDETRRWQVFGVEQTGQLSLANARTQDVIAVVSGCEARDRQVARPWWRLF